MDVPYTHVEARDTASGAEVTFTTTSTDRVRELRNRVLAMADLRNDRLSGVPPGSAQHGAVGSMGAGPAMRPGASWATVEDVDGGARMTVTTESPIEVDRLRDSVRTRALRLAQVGGCAGDWIP
jgi:hypothetical protein